MVSGGLCGVCEVKVCCRFPAAVVCGGNGNNRMLHLKERCEIYEMVRLKYLMLWR